MAEIEQDGATLIAMLNEAYNPLWAARQRVEELAARAACRIARETWGPEAKYLILEVSDQGYDSGWWLFNVLDNEKKTLPSYDDDSEDGRAIEAPEVLWQPLSDLDWERGAVVRNTVGQGVLEVDFWLDDSTGLSG